GSEPGSPGRGAPAVASGMRHGSVFLPVPATAPLRPTTAPISANNNPQLCGALNNAARWTPAMVPVGLATSLGKSPSAIVNGHAASPAGGSRPTRAARCLAVALLPSAA